MRATILVLFVALAAGCGDDSGGGTDLAAAAGDDLAASADLAGDLGCSFGTFPGFGGVQTATSFDCSCGCMIDSMELDGVAGIWGKSTTSGAMFVPMPGVGLGVSLTTSGTLEQAGLASEAGPSFPSVFYLDGDFDLLVDYDFGATPPPGPAELVLGVRKPEVLSGTPQYEVERERLADGSDAYATMLGGVPATLKPTTATHGTLELQRVGYTLTSLADGQQVATLVSNYPGRLVVTLAATLSGCSGDAGASCGYQPRWHLMRLNSGKLVNMP